MPCGEGHPVSRRKLPGGGKINPVVERIIAIDGNLVATVIDIGEPAAVVDASVRDTTFAPGQGVGQPTREVTCRLLHQPFGPIGPADAGRDGLFPLVRAREHQAVVPELQDVPQVLVVDLRRQAPTRNAGIIHARRPLVRFLGRDPVRHRNPDVRRKVHAGKGKPVDILGHPGITGLERPGIGNGPTRGQPRLERRIVLSTGREQGEMEARIQRNASEGYLILQIGGSLPTGHVGPG